MQTQACIVALPAQTLLLLLRAALEVIVIFFQQPCVDHRWVLAPYDIQYKLSYTKVSSSTW